VRKAQEKITEKTVKTTGLQEKTEEITLKMAEIREKHQNRPVRPYKKQAARP
jgi:predicted ATP-grasp superfamily ATP-dependent carboligase